MIDITDRAAEQLRSLAATAGRSGLRIVVAQGGCSGLHYEMNLGEPQPDDLVVECKQARLFVAEQNSSLLRDAILDYKDSLTGAGFYITNPNAARTCGCGSSFEPARSP